MVALILQSLIRYIVFTSKHSDGYSLYPTNVTYQWNSRDVGAKRDLIGKYIYSKLNCYLKLKSTEKKTSCMVKDWTCTM